MKRERYEPARPYGGHEYELIRAGPEGSYWRADGIEVRIAAAEHERKNARGRLQSEIAPLTRLFLGGVFAR